ncbi:hypothetical protein BGX21_007616 [Mortierella sp. AD011]|nr:hypothetical protein BGX20_000780 [Mortierella sp. AD010]KAF9403007.1 hypothetical protein BGX21_007616 [Mortierella sp. AD011]
MAYTTVNEKTLYIQGGTDPATHTNSGQIYSLDLTQSWSASNPPWKALNSQQAPVDYSHSMVVSGDKRSLIIWGSLTEISIYNIAAGTWSTTPKPSSATINQNGLRAVTDPNTGLVYIPAGANNGTSTMEFNPSTGIGQQLPIPSAFNGSVTHYSAAWTSQRTSVLMYGGFYQLSSSITVHNIYQYSPSSSSWSSISAAGVIPGSMNGHCLVSAYNGTKMVMFGGQIGRADQKTPLGSIYILDVQTWTWTKGADINPSLARNGMACAVSGDYFIAWGGGQSEKYVSSLLIPVIYNLQAGQWVDQFIAANNNRGPSGAVIGGAAVGALVIIAIAVFVFWRSRSSKKRNNDNMAYISVESGGSGDSDDKKSSNIDLQDIRPSQDHILGTRYPVSAQYSVSTQYPVGAQHSMGAQCPMGAQYPIGTQYPTSTQYPESPSRSPQESRYYTDSAIHSIADGHNDSLVYPPVNTYEYSQAASVAETKALQKPAPNNPQLYIQSSSISEIPEPRNPQEMQPEQQTQFSQQARYSHDPNTSIVEDQALLERQIAEIKAQRDQKLKEQQKLERIRLEHQAHLELLEQRLDSSRRATQIE